MMHATFTMVFRCSCALFLLVALPPGGYSGQAKSGSGTREYSPEDAILTIRPHTGQSVFQIGEMIELDMAFTSTATQNYHVNASTFDRPYGPDHITITPVSGWDDPVGEFDRFCSVSYEGGLQDIKNLSATATVAPVELNAWVRFTEPGEYQVVVESGRVTARNGRGQTATLSSNRLSIRIIPATEQWQEQTLANALAVLDSTRTAARNLSWTERKARMHAAKIVRYLGTPGAAREMGRRIHYPDLTYDFLLGFVSFPARNAAMDQMNALLVDPKFLVYDLDLCAMSVVAGPADAAAQKAELARLREELRSALQNKRGQALAVSTATANGGR
jgi:hypothetical protein